MVHTDSIVVPGAALDAGAATWYCAGLGSTSGQWVLPSWIITREASNSGECLEDSVYWSIVTALSWFTPQKVGSLADCWSGRFASFLTTVARCRDLAVFVLHVCVHPNLLTEVTLEETVGSFDRTVELLRVRVLRDLQKWRWKPTRKGLDDDSWNSLQRRDLVGLLLAQHHTTLKGCTRPSHKPRLPLIRSEFKWIE